MNSRKYSRPPARAWSLIIGAMFLLPACRSYTQKTERAVALFERGQFEEAQRLFEDKDVTGSTFLSGAEAGMVALTAGNLEGAIENFSSAANFAEDIEDQALLDPTALAKSLTAFALSETALDYKGEGYERVMVHACLGLAYLAQGKVEDLLVEVRRANDLLAAEEKLYDTDYKAGGFGHLLSAIGYELRGEMDEAYIDYLSLYDKGVGLGLIGPSLVRLSEQLYRQDDHERFLAEFGEAQPIPEDAARIVLLAGVGRGPIKIESRLDVPTGNGVFSWAVPSFVAPTNSVGKIELRAGGLAASSVIVEDVAHVAEKNLSDRLAYLGARSAVRGILKQKLARELRKKHGEGAYAVAQIFSMVTERADVRSWVTLPATWQAARLYPRPGLVDLDLVAIGGESLSLGTYEMEPGETIFLLVRTVGPRVFAQVLGGRLVDLVEQAPAPVPNTSTNP